MIERGEKKEIACGHLDFGACVECLREKPTTCGHCGEAKPTHWSSVGRGWLCEDCQHWYATAN